jgi:type III secretion protein J
MLAPPMKLRIAFVLACAVLLAGCSVDLQHGLTEQDANDIYVLLNTHGISCTKLVEEGGNTPTYLIKVSKSDAAQAAELLNEYSLPRPPADGLSIFAKTKGMIPTQTEERAMFLEALGGEVSNALNRIDGVLEAKTIVMIPEDNDLTQPDKKPHPSASVFVKYRPTIEGKSPIDEQRIRNFVSTAVPEMKPEFVTVLLSEAQPVNQDVNPDTRMVDVVGLRMTAGSVGQFKLMMGLVGLLVLVMIGFTSWTLMRGAPQAKPMRARSRPPEA